MPVEGASAAELGRSPRCQMSRYQVIACGLTSLSCKKRSDVVDRQRSPEQVALAQSDAEGAQGG
jgi:hypothetical protein